ncbi:hypothetical protein CU669_02905 [Paramagnetospirillum kuznetsovii]|uniref:ABC transporter n=1 Tax=Paramagnetospirillum kuznetsovii TaxID=2053833 RepID=A0A364P1D3_9PROT|nr:VacJ family lipoprotein [Paramagnetospirillum kuznetsovii]RAU23131.1 hypothetical protein CU669_02905 [Paramagnetospirillum kuznetsovii]
MARGLVSVAAAAAVAILGACATLPEDPEERAEAEAVNDPLEPTNRAIYDVNAFLDESIMEPVAQVYSDNFPEWFRQALHNFLNNLNEPYIAGNDLLQGNPRAAADALGRFMINTTFGLLGTQDSLADSGGPKGHKTDIGVTFGAWGFSEGPYLMLPFFGPSNLRDGLGKVADNWANPVGSVISAYGLEAFNNAQMGADIVDGRTELLDPIKELRRTSLDEYAAIRSLYRQNRDAAIAASLNGQVRPGHDGPPSAAASEAKPVPASATVPAAAPVSGPASPSMETGAAQSPDPKAAPSAVEFVDPSK